MNVADYLKRINYNEQVAISPDCLRRLHRCHVMSVPFEALDVQWKRPIRLDQRKLFQKVVISRRGGFCYELNYLFYCLLIHLGFDASIISAQIFDQGVLGPPFDHMCIIVKLDEYWLLDVGYGDLFIEPLRLYATCLQKDIFKDYKIEPINDSEFLLLESLKGKGNLKKKYLLGIKPKSIRDFSEQCQSKQSSPDSYFVKNTICTLPTPAGRKTIFNHTFQIRDKNRVIQAPVADNNALVEILREQFGIFY